MKSPSPPQPADPAVVGQQQTATNIGTAIATQRGSMVNQTTPYGDLSFDQTGTHQYTDPVNGSVYDIPTYTASQTYTPTGQAIVDAEAGASLNLAQLAETQSGRLNNLLDTPVKLGNEEVESHLFDLGRKRLDPMFAERKEKLNQNLADRGIGMDSDAYSRAMRDFDYGENDAYNQLALTGRGQAINEQLTERNQPINEIIGLMSGSQVQQPQFASAPSFNPATTDMAGIYANNFNQKMQNYQSSGSDMGGLFALGGTALQMAPSLFAMSDRRLKRDIQRIGAMVSGVPVYLFRYLWSDDWNVGVMAQEALAVTPEAVIKTPSGYLAVNYGALQ